MTHHHSSTILNKTKESSMLTSCAICCYCTHWESFACQLETNISLQVLFTGDNGIHAGHVEQNTQPLKGTTVQSCASTNTHARMHALQKRILCDLLTYHVIQRAKKRKYVPNQTTIRNYIVHRNASKLMVIVH